MTKLVLATFLAVTLTASAALAEDCEKYQFGSQEWWQCKTSQHGTNN